MTWYEITIAVAGAFGGVELVKFLWSVIFNRKNNSRIANTEATNAEIAVEKNKAMAAVEAKEAAEDSHTKQCKQYEERISDLHSTIDKLNEQLDGYVERIANKEKRFAEQTDLLRERQRDLLNLEKEKADMEVMYLKKVSSLEMELERKRCDDEPCPFRQPPNARTQAIAGLTKDRYFKKRNELATAANKDKEQ